MLLEELIERTIFHAFRLEVVDRGYLPNIFDYDIENISSVISKAEEIRYNNDILAIKNLKGFAIEIFNYSTNQSYGDKNVPRIVIRTDAFLPGNLGMEPRPGYVRQPDGSYKLSKSVEMVSDFYFSVHLVASSTKTIRELHDIMVNVLPRRGYIRRYTDVNLRPDSNLLIQYISNTDVSYLAEGIIEKIYRYMIPDVHEIDDKLLPGIIMDIKEIKVDEDEDENNIITVN